MAVNIAGFPGTLPLSPTELIRKLQTPYLNHDPSVWHRKYTYENSFLKKFTFIVA
jgi:hypothetical protein